MCDVATQAEHVARRWKKRSWLWQSWFKTAVQSPPPPHETANLRLLRVESQNHNMRNSQRIVGACWLLGLLAASVDAFTLGPPSSAVSRQNTELHSFLDYLKWGGSEPEFDVLEKTKQYVQEEGFVSFNLSKIPSDYYDERYIFRGPIVGPINRKDLVTTNSLFGLEKSFPDLKRETFGLCVDPDNPYRVLFFERWKATHTGEFNLMGLLKTDATQQKSISPAFPFSITWTPEGKIIYECLTTAVDRFEGNTKGKVAVFGLLETAGIPLENGVGNPFLRVAQKIGRFVNLPAQTYSREEDIPSWWKSSARAADPNDI